MFYYTIGLFDESIDSFQNAILTIKGRKIKIIPQSKYLFKNETEYQLCEKLKY